MSNSITSTFSAVNTDAKSVYVFSKHNAAFIPLCETLECPYAVFDSPEVFLQQLTDDAVNANVNLVLFDLRDETISAFQKIRHRMLKEQALAGIPFVVIAPYPSLQWRQLCQKFKVTDYVLFSLAQRHLKGRLSHLLRTTKPEKKESAITQLEWRLPLWKRAMDLAGASILLLLLSPLLLTVILLIKLESKGPIFYVSKRAGQGFRVFDFIKFRSMRPDADQLVEQLQDLNQYTTPEEEEKNALRSQPLEQDYTVLVKDDAYTFEEEAFDEKTSTFFKVKNDPRITHIGHFIRNTSIDELPQLFNVLKGDMSLVGNRPLPLYEAEQLTEDHAILRFAAPAGITGLWQVNKRGKGDMSEEERKQLDIRYALEYNFWMDLKILWKTLPAAVQEESV
ncbi:sugar transferase [Lewinella sp. LCG006]|uniref:sugar transferase n=1 Tax=Lewinella sp. LCG006 TaxID=3231911 RepID=UPI0034603480